MFAVDMLRMKKKPSGSGATVSAITPANEDDSGTLASNTFSAHTLTVTGGTSVSYVWSFPANNGLGTWTINSGQGTAGAIPRVTGVADLDFATATLRCTVTDNGTDFVRDCSITYSRDTGGGATMTL